MMQDIDFDELDRAVNSVTQPDVPAAAAVTPEVAAPVINTDPRPTPVGPVTPAARRSTGRFMDVVHPSSDMRSSSTPPTPVERSVPRFELPKEVAQPVRSSDWPDPLDFQGFKDDEPEEPKQEAPAATPLDSPFLSDAKVEKRPLGAFSDAESNSSTDDSQASKDFAASIAEPEMPLLEESEEELLPAETLTKEVVSEPGVAASAPESIPEPAAVPVPQEEPIGPTSITQQYKEQPSTTDQPSGAIFDTEAYHQPLVHAAKKKSGALVVVWIAALILVGAGAGAAVYFFVLPLL